MCDIEPVLIDACFSRAQGVATEFNRTRWIAYVDTLAKFDAEQLALWTAAWGGQLSRTARGPEARVVFRSACEVVGLAG